MALGNCIDLAKFELDAIAKVFLVDGTAVRSSVDLGWARMLILDALVLASADAEMRMERLLVMRAMKEKAKEMAGKWKQGLEGCRGIENAKPMDVHAFLQHLVTFGFGMKEDKVFEDSTCRISDKFRNWQR